jgi:hypothetical protein
MTALDSTKLFYSNLHFTDLSAILVIYGQNVSLSKLQLKFIQTKAWVVVDYWWTKKKKEKREGNGFHQACRFALTRCKI